MWISTTDVPGCLYLPEPFFFDSYTWSVLIQHLRSRKHYYSFNVNRIFVIDVSLYPSCSRAVYNKLRYLNEKWWIFSVGRKVERQNGQSDRIFEPIGFGICIYRSPSCAKIHIWPIYPADAVSEFPRHLYREEERIQEGILPSGVNVASMYYHRYVAELNFCRHS